MSRYIDKDKLIENLNYFAPENYNSLINDLITKQPEADVVEFVRCKDCIWWEKQSDSLQGRCCLFVNHLMYPTGNWYCANGKRKKDEE